MDLGLAGRKAIVAGASRGIGAAIAALLKVEGSSVAICGRDAAAVDEARISLEKSPDGAVFASVADLADADQARKFARDAVEALGGLDIYVHNATGGAGTGDEGWLRTLAVDVIAPIRILEVVMPALEASGAGSIVLIGSTASVQWFPRPGGQATAYGPAKAAQRALVNELGQSLGRQRIRANVISPGSTYSEGSNWDEMRETHPEVWQGLIRQFPFRQLMTTTEIARVVAFVASPAGSGINATHIVVDGGQHKGVQ
jgi:NAD(P)-dependent dehydrogenase (short-subunit alcohol dehydrogenase family)